MIECVEHFRWDMSDGGGSANWPYMPPIVMSAGAEHASMKAVSGSCVWHMSDGGGPATGQSFHLVCYLEGVTGFGEPRE